MTREELMKIEDILNGLDEEELLRVHNEYESYGDDEIFPMDMFDELCVGMTPTDIAQRIFFGDFNPNHNYFKYNGYANFESTDYPTDWIYVGDIAKYMLDHEECFGLDEVEELFDKWNNEEEEE